jgi:hypothetical protein
MNIYCTATNTGKDFITTEDKKNFNITQLSNSVYHIDNHKEADGASGLAWIERVGATRKTVEEAQAIVDAEITQAQATYELLNADEKVVAQNPKNVILKP